MNDIECLIGRIEINFGEMLEKMFEIIGPEAANFVENKAELELKLIELFDEQQDNCYQVCNNVVSLNTKEYNINDEIKIYYKPVLNLQTEFYNKFVDKMNDKQREVERIFKQIEDLEREKSQIESIIGLSGSNLIQFLIEVRKFLKITKGRTMVYFPINSILTGFYY